MMRKTKIATAAGIAALALAGTGAGVAMADTSTSAPKPPATADAAAHHKHGMLGRIEHGEVTVGGAKPKVIDLQRGTVQKVDANSITVRSKDGFVGTYVVNGETKVHKEKAQSTISKVTTGDQVRLRAVKNGATATAKMIGDRGPAKH
jgi:hypothetical protein